VDASALAAREREVEERLKAREQQATSSSDQKDHRRDNDNRRADVRRDQIHSDSRGKDQDGERRGGDRRDGGESEEHHEDKARRERSSPKPPKKLEEKTPNFAGSNKFAFLQDDDEVGSGKEDSNEEDSS